MTEPDSRSKPVLSGPSTNGFLVTLLISALLLFWLARMFTHLPCFGVFVVTSVAAAPIWLFLAQRSLLTRRAIIQSIGTETGYLQRWFSAGTLSRILLVFVALGMAFLLLGLLAGLRITEWAILAVDALLLGLIFPSIKQSLANQIRAEHQGLVARLWPVLAINVVVLTASFVVLDLFSARTVIQGSWGDIAGEAFRRTSQGAACPAVASIVGALAALDELAWKAAIWSIPRLPDTPTKLAGWIAFLAWTGFSGLLFTQFMLGVIAYVDDRLSAALTRPSTGTVWRAFIATIVVLLAVYLYASWKMSTWEPPAPPPAVGGNATRVDPCATFRFDATTLQTELRTDINQARLMAHGEADRRVDEALDVAFARAEQGVDSYLEWYFSLYGDYSRLAAVMVGDLDKVMQDRLAQDVFDNTGFAAVLESENLEIQGEILEQVTSVAGALSERVRQAVDTSRCPIPTIDITPLYHLERDRLRLALSTTGGVTAATATIKAVGKKAASAAVAKAAASSSIKLAAKIAGKAVAKKGTSTALGATTGVVVCAPTGPLAVLCGIAAGVITWFVVDKAAIEVEELVSRDAMRADLMRTLQEQRQQLKGQLKTLHRGLADAYAQEINRRADQVFVPARDGL